MKDISKRAFDLALALPALILSLPVQALTALAVRVSMGRPILFRQARPGLNGEPFEMIKFRSMLEPDPKRGLIDDTNRMTRLGGFLRSTSLDELPSLWNVLKGDMSIVGPRPLLTRYLNLYSAEQARRHEVRPGLTGLAQVNGRNAISWNEKFEYDIEYVNNHSVIGDLRIIARSAMSVLRRDGISAEDEATMPEFMGNET